MSLLDCAQHILIVDIHTDILRLLSGMLFTLFILNIFSVLCDLLFCFPVTFLLIFLYE